MKKLTTAQLDVDAGLYTLSNGLDPKDTTTSTFVAACFTFDIQ